MDAEEIARIRAATFKRASSIIQKEYENMRKEYEKYAVVECEDFLVRIHSIFAEIIEELNTLSQKEPEVAHVEQKHNL